MDDHHYSHTVKGAFARFAGSNEAKDIGKAAFARFGDNDKVKGIITFVEEFDVGATHRVLITVAVFSDVNSPKAKFSGGCRISINGLRVKDIDISRLEGWLSEIKRKGKELFRALCIEEQIKQNQLIKEAIET
ncbi:16932_t:CDS:2 [Entrophospora sp. SA101]|nr:16932_t:CDS:2 [Entrophospora sp. SA101]